MNQLMDYLSNLEKELDNSDTIIKLINYRNIIYKNKKLMELIKKYNLTKDSNTRLEVYKNKDFMEYKKYENEVNLLIMGINNELKKIYDNGD